MLVQSILDTKGARVVTIAPQATVADLIDALAANNIGAVVVSANGDDVLGIVSERDVVRGLARQGAALLGVAVERIMTRTVRTCAPDDPAERLMAEMTTGRVRHLPVIVDGRLAGIVSIGDVVKDRLRQLEREASALRDYITRG